MRYIYYIIGIFILLTLCLAFFLHERGQLEMSRTAIAVNDRKISEAELERLMRKKPHDMTEDKYIDSLIMNELLIQEAIGQSIHREEAFRRSVENFYEQSLIKILLDRKYESFAPIVTAAEIEKYRELTGKTIFITKHVYPGWQAAAEKTGGHTEPLAVRFEVLSDNLKFIALSLAPGQSSKPRETRQGVVVYTLEKIEKQEQPAGIRAFPPDMDAGAIRTFIRDQKKERLYDRWTEELRANARIWRQK